MTDFPDRFLELKEIYLDNRGQWERLKINSSELVSDRPVLKFAGVNTKEQAMRLTNRMLAVPRDQLVELPEDKHYIFELIGCRVFDEETGEEVGELTDVLRYPANDAYVIKLTGGTEVLFPAVGEFVKEIDAEGKKIVVKSAGLLGEAENKDGK